MRDVGIIFFFFFQAEDGIRDSSVTGVQTCALPILPPEVEDRHGDFKAAESLIGCGPFALERYEPGVKAVFARNPTYYEQGLPHLDKVEWLFLKDRSTQLSLFRAGQVDLPSYDARIPRSDARSLEKSNPSYPVVHWDGLAVRSLAMRTDRPPSTTCGCAVPSASRWTGGSG